MNKQKWQNILSVLLFLLVLVLVPVCSYYLQNYFQKKETILTVKIDLANTTLENINAGLPHINYDGNRMTVTSGLSQTVYNDVGVEGRGNSTWTGDKKPYQITFRDRVSFENLGEGRKWVFLADAFDNSKLRNNIAFYIERMLDEDYALNGKYVNLTIDGKELGLYYVTPKVELGRGRVDLDDHDAVLVELENLHAISTSCPTLDKDCILLADANNEDNADILVDGIRKEYDNLLDAAKRRSYTEVEQIADTTSLAKYFLLSEFSSNPDAYNTSFFMYKDGENDLIHFGPGWDFDFAFANRNSHWTEYGDMASPYSTMAQKSYAMEKGSGYTLLFYYLMDIPEFSQLVKRIFREKMSGKSDELIEYLYNQRDLIYDAAKKDDELAGRETFDDEIEYLADWLIKRFDHFEQEYGTQRLQPWNSPFVL